MAKRFDVYPDYIGELLREWGKYCFVQSMTKVARGYPSRAAFIVLRVDGQPREVQLWTIPESELERLDGVINRLETKHIMALNWAFVPHRRQSSEAWLKMSDTGLRTWQRWVHDAAGEVQAVWDRECALG